MGGMKSTPLEILHLQRGADLHTVANSASDGTKIGMNPEHTLGGLAVLGLDFQVVGHVNSLDDQNLVLLPDFPFGF
jgi:hypothetical protein